MEIAVVICVFGVLLLAAQSYMARRGTPRWQSALVFGGLLAAFFGVSVAVFDYVQTTGSMLVMLGLVFLTTFTIWRSPPP